MERASTLLLKIAVILLGTPALALIIFGLPWLINNPVNPVYAHILYPVIIGLYITIIPFLQPYIKLLSY